MPPWIQAAMVAAEGLPAVDSGDGWALEHVWKADIQPLVLHTFCVVSVDSAPLHRRSGLGAAALTWEDSS